MNRIKMDDHPVLAAIRHRRSVRHFTQEPISDEVVDQILEAGRWAPSGKNNQPWRFAVIREPSVRASLASLTHYGSVLRAAPILIAVFLDHGQVYDRTKDVLAVGACIQNMLLAIHALGLGGVWLGEILKNKERVGEVLGACNDWELMAVIALGHPSSKKGGKGERAPLQEKVFWRR
ncbi:MAG: nitroreductase family protein [Desulfobacterota bacterium]|nr:nitroreductase family protein [Thermodesulfobacteriota bacterium]